MPTLRDTVQVKHVLGLLLARPDHEWYAYEMAGVSGFGSATVAAVLKRLTAHGWLEDRDEEGDPAVLERKLRVYYRLLPDKAEEARAWLAAARPMPVLAPIDLS